MATKPNFGETPVVDLTTFTSADTTALKAIVTDPGVNGGFVRSIVISMDETVDVFVDLWITKSATDYLLRRVKVPAYSGYENASNVVIIPYDVFDAGGAWASLVNANGLMEVKISNGVTLKASMKATLTASKSLYIMATTVVY